MKRSLILVIHILSFLLALTSFIALRSYSIDGLGISWISSGSFEDSVQFSEMISSDLANLKKLAVLKEAFETDGNLDEDKLIISAETSKGGANYTVRDVMSIAQKFGYSLDNNHSLAINSGSEANNYEIRLIYKSYDPYYFNNIAPGPSQGVMSVKDMSVEVLRSIAEYYSLKKMLEPAESNLVYNIFFESNEGEDVNLTNAGENLEDRITSYGRYLILNNDYTIKTNITPQPSNIMPDEKTFGYADVDGSLLQIGVDTMYLYADRYKAASDSFDGYISRAYGWLGGLIAGLLLTVITLVFVVRDGEARDHNKAFVMDRLPIEGMVLMLAFGAVLCYALFRVMLYNFMEVLAEEGTWNFWCKTAKSVDIYIFCVVILCSMYRRSYNGGVFQNSLLNRMMLALTDDSVDTVWTTLCSYSIYFILNAICIGGCVWCLSYRDESRYYIFTAIMLLVAAAALNVFVYVRVFSRNKQRVMLNRALKRISEGDVEYTIPENGFTGGELDAARSINSISDGLSSAINEQVKADRLKTDLITNVSHDIKTPLTSIINYVDLIKRENVQDEKVREYIEVLDKKSARLKNLVEDLVEASKASSGNIKMDMCRLDMAELAGQAGGEFEDKFAKRNLEFNLSVPETSAFIWADGRHLWRVFENLLNNAAKYAMENTRIYADVKVDEENCIFSIKNVSQDRLNISPDELTERFIRGDVSRSTEGSGLGLNIAKSLTNLMGGKLVIEIDGDLYKASVVMPRYTGDEMKAETKEGKIEIG